MAIFETRSWLLAGAVASMILLGACASPSAPKTPASGPQVSAAATSTAAPAVAATATAPAAPSAGTSRGANRYVIVPDQSEARYRVQEQLVGRNLPNEAVGKTKSVSGGITFNANGAVDPATSKITVDLRTLKSDSNQRDGFIQQSTLQTRQFPNAEFAITEVKGLPSPIPTSGEANVQLAGNLTVHGVTKPVIWDTTVKFGNSDILGNAVVSTKISDFGMTPPKAGPVLSIEDAIKLEMDFEIVRDGV